MSHCWNKYDTKVFWNKIHTELMYLKPSEKYLNFNTIYMRTCYQHQSMRNGCIMFVMAIMVVVIFNGNTAYFPWKMLHLENKQQNGKMNRITSEMIESDDKYHINNQQTSCYKYSTVIKCKFDLYYLLNVVCYIILWKHQCKDISIIWYWKQNFEKTATLYSIK